jgi:hypothetical protein
MKKLYIIFILFIISIFNIQPATLKIQVIDKSLRFNTGIGVGYHFKISTDYSEQTESFFLEIPLRFGLDYRFSDWFSLYWGTDIVYGLHTYLQSFSGTQYTFYINNLFIKVPFDIKFYPMVQRNEAFNNFYISTGIFLHFWPMNIFYTNAKGHSDKYGNSYIAKSLLMPPGTVYTPVNIGTKLAIGNQFFIADHTLFGLELFGSYMFIPYLNGYYPATKYSRGRNVVVEFSATVGISLSIAVELIRGY